ncbi:CPBP family intramembrane glutamic endopeptidase [Microbacterium sp. CH12i]|uniref:CPBP family intramembrane glutamic endopeptidase n=1 Tax=Microbacterium sp. CH12i TaxID=1479651 RepID=UPI003FA52FE4
MHRARARPRTIRCLRHRAARVSTHGFDAAGRADHHIEPLAQHREIFDLIYQVLGVGFSIVPVLLVCFLLWQSSRPHLGRLGLDGTRVGRDVGRGILLVLAIGIPGLALYVGGRMLGLFVAVNPGSLDAYWWTAPVLLLSAARAALMEEFVVLGYLFTRLKQLGWGTWPIIIATSVLRASYHLYQGPGAFIGNLAMGLLFGWLFARTGRLLPFLVAHFLIDAVASWGTPWWRLSSPSQSAKPRRDSVASRLSRRGFAV